MSFGALCGLFATLTVYGLRGRAPQILAPGTVRIKAQR
jgi:hypothetical protein